MSDTITRLAAMRDQLSQTMPSPGQDRLRDLIHVGSNPGALRARTHIPDDLAAGAPLVVVLHGCTQTAAAYDHGSGWSTLADRHGFAVLFPEQSVANNMNRCFNWFQPEDTTRDSGEALSIRQMVEAVIEAHDLDPTRVFVTGLSAGGAMTSVMLATYPEVFAGGAIIAGLPYGSATTVSEAMDRMRGHGGLDEDALAALVHAASDHDGPWPRVSVWHGSADRTVVHANAARIVAQWRLVHGIGRAPTHSGMIDGQRRDVWCNAAGEPVIESITVADMAHGTPLDPTGADGVGESGPFMLDSGISSTVHIAAFWGLLADIALDDTREAVVATQAPAPEVKRAIPQPTLAADTARPAAGSGPHGVQQVIEDALRAAGLMR
ncbi:hypothetical protein ASE75_05470 [Sphingomonas sp. Leaf17]|nr:hypothetical protein ASE75_05470 [Sphingomonas sp. Leaf17]